MIFSLDPITSYCACCINLRNVIFPIRVKLDWQEGVDLLEYQESRLLVWHTCALVHRLLNAIKATL